jgi:hypothetical protein
VTLNNQKAQFSEIKPGMIANVTGGDLGVASRISVTSGGPKLTTSKVAPKETRVRIGANNIKAKPVVVGNVTAGQTVTVTPIKVWWCGGGSKKKEHCDWRGYDKSNIRGKHWMALIAAVGEETFAPTGSTMTFTVPADGTLVLYANDDRAEDNLGSGEVTLSIAAP